MNAAPLPFGLSVCGIEELAGHTETRASHVLSILDPDHPVPEAFGAWGEHEKVELRFHDDIEALPGRSPPQPFHVERVLALGRDLMAEPASVRHLLVHCHAGISRSTASMALIIAQALPALGADEVMDTLLSIRAKAWPNLRMLEMGDGMLGRGGALPAAAHRLYHVQLQRRPELEGFMNDLGRQREVEAGKAYAPA